MPLKGIPKQLSPELLHVLASMGHGDEIVLADAFFPTSSICSHGPREIRADGLGAPELLEAVVQLFPLDPYVDCPVSADDGQDYKAEIEIEVAKMALVPSDEARGLKTPVWDKYKAIVNAAEKKEVSIEPVERFAFYERAKKAYAVVHTGETEQYANIILKKGI